jgi:hypothetical protein
MSTAELVALELRLDAERAVRSEDALALRLIDRLKRQNAQNQKSTRENGATQ